MAIYCGWITFEFIIVYFLYPETYGRTLEELTFCMLILSSRYTCLANQPFSVRG